MINFINNKGSSMECYLKSWEGIAKEYQAFSRNNINELKMNNSLKYEDDKEKTEGNDSGADSLPIHCIIQTFSSLRDLKALHCQHCSNKNTSVGSWWECECKKNEMSGCIVVPENTTMDDLVRTALMKLGYPAFVSSFATGSILIRNWNPLPLEVICPDMKKTVTEILGEITGVISLRIQIFRPKITVSQKMKDDLLSFLLKTNQSFLRESHCPFDLSVLSKFCDQSASMKMHLLHEPPEDLQRKFETWLEQLQEAEKASTERKNQFPSSFFLPNNSQNISSNNNQNCGGKKAMPGLEPIESHAQETNGKHSKMNSEKENLNFVKECSFIVVERQKHFPIPKTRVRTSFDPEFELPKLQKWYLKNPHPTRQQIFEYVAELNSLESRKGRKQLDVNNVVYWFKNARAAQKRTECRRLSNGPPPETNRCNVLKIPLGKNSVLTSDDQKFISDDEASATSESEDDARQENGRCLQVVGKWNSNGQGEAVLEMQIPSRKTECAPPEIVTKKEKIDEEDENSKNSEEKTADSIKQDYEKKNSQLGGSEKGLNVKENQGVNSEEDKNGNKINEVNGNQQSQNEESESEISSKASARSNFPLYKESKGVNGNDFLPPYKSGFSVPPNSGFNPPFICMSPYMNSKPNNFTSSEERRKRNRTFIDPVTEVPRLEQWFRLSTHPSQSLIARYTEELNNMPYRRKFPKLEAKNVQFWFKNRRAKNKRLNFIETMNS